MSVLDKDFSAHLSVCGLLVSALPALDLDWAEPAVLRAGSLCPGLQAPGSARSALEAPLSLQGCGTRSPRQAGGAGAGAVLPGEGRFASHRLTAPFLSLELKPSLKL